MDDLSDVDSSLERYRMRNLKKFQESISTTQRSFQLKKYISKNQESSSESEEEPPKQTQKPKASNEVMAYLKYARKHGLKYESKKADEETDRTKKSNVYAVPRIAEERGRNNLLPNDPDMMTTQQFETRFLAPDSNRVETPQVNANYIDRSSSEVYAPMQHPDESFNDAPSESIIETGREKDTSRDPSQCSKKLSDLYVHTGEKSRRVLEESMLLNPYHSKKGQTIEVMGTQETFAGDRGQYGYNQRTTESEYGEFNFKRPSTIQEVSEAHMEETEANKSSIIRNSGETAEKNHNLLYGVGQVNVFKGSDFNSRAESKATCSGVATPCLEGGAELVGQQFSLQQHLNAQRTLLSHHQQHYLNIEERDSFEVQNPERGQEIREDSELFEEIPINDDEYVNTSNSLVNQSKTHESSMFQTHQQSQVSCLEAGLQVICLIKKGGDKAKQPLVSILKKKDANSDNGSACGRRSCSMNSNFKALKKVPFRSFSSMTNRSQNYSQLVNHHILTTSSKDDMSTRSLNSFDEKPKLGHNLARQGSQAKPQYNTNDAPFFTTSEEISSILLKQSQESVNKIPNFMVQALMQKNDDLRQFLYGNSNGENLRMFEFDCCLNEHQHKEKQIKKAFKDLFQQNQKNVMLLFGNTKGFQFCQQEQGLVETTIQKICKSESIRYVKATFLLEDKDIVIGQKMLQQNLAYRFLQMEISKMMTDKDNLVQNLVDQNPAMTSEIRNCGHVVLQVNNHFFIQMADIDGLKKLNAPRTVQNLTNDFGTMTNEILKLSPYYNSHNFVVNEQQRVSALTRLLSNLMTKRVGIQLVTLINNSWAESQSQLMAVDFTHKIKQYFQGSSDACPIQSLLAQVDRETIQTAQMMARRIQQLLKKLIKVEQQCRFTHEQALRRFQIKVGNKSTLKMEDERQRLKQQVDQLSREACESVLPEMSSTVYAAQLEQVKDLVFDKISSISSSIDQIEKLMSLKQSIKVIQNSRNHSPHISKAVAGTDLIHTFSTFGELGQKKMGNLSYSAIPEVRLQEDTSLSQQRRDLLNEKQSTIEKENACLSRDQSASMGLNFDLINDISEMDDTSYQMDRKMKQFSNTKEESRMSKRHSRSKKKRKSSFIARETLSSLNKQRTAFQKENTNSRKVSARRRSNSKSFRGTSSARKKSIKVAKKSIEVPFKSSFNQSQTNLHRCSSSVGATSRQTDRKSVSITRRKASNKKKRPTQNDDDFTNNSKFASKLSHSNIASQEQLLNLIANKSIVSTHSDNMMYNSRNMPNDFDNTKQYSSHNNFLYEMQTLKNKSFKSDENSNSIFGFSRKQSNANGSKIKMQKSLTRKASKLSKKQLRKNSKKVLKKKDETLSKSMLDLMDQENATQSHKTSQRRLNIKSILGSKLQTVEAKSDEDEAYSNFLQEKQIAQLRQQVETLQQQNDLLKSHRMKQTQPKNDEVMNLRALVNKLEMQNVIKDEMNKRLQEEMLGLQEKNRQLKKREKKIDHENKSLRISELKAEIDNLREVLRVKDQHMHKMKSRMESLQTQYQIQMDQLNERHNHIAHKSQIELQFSLLQEKYLDIEEDLQIKNHQLDEVSMERDQLFDQLKAMKKQLSKQNGHLQSLTAYNSQMTSIEEPILTARSRLKKSLVRKNEVLNDIKSSIAALSNQINEAESRGILYQHGS